MGTVFETLGEVQSDYVRNAVAQVLEHTED
jgi:hypothetical protein